MANIRLLANLNCDHVLLLAAPLTAGSRLHYQEQGRRLGGGGANTGVGLVWAGHKVSVLTCLGEDATGDWVIEQAQDLGLDTQYIERVTGDTPELLILVDTQGERTILRQPRTVYLPSYLPIAPCDCLYVNYDGDAATAYMAAMLAQGLVVSQYPQAGKWHRPCHIMIASASDLGATNEAWQHAKHLAGHQLQWLVITNGAKGAQAISANQSVSVPAMSTRVVDTTGAGDTFAAGLIHALLAGNTMLDALRQATLWATYTLSQRSSIPSEQLKYYLQSSSAADFVTSHC